jgi:hypothetical protein
MNTLSTRYIECFIDTPLFYYKINRDIKWVFMKIMIICKKIGDFLMIHTIILKLFDYSLILEKRNTFTHPYLAYINNDGFS